MQSLKLAYFCWESLYSIKVGGLSPAATHLAEMLARQHEVHFFTRGEGPDREIQGVHYHYCQPAGRNIVEYCDDMSRIHLRKFKELDDPPFDIIHFHDWHFTGIMPEFAGRRTVMTYHSTEYGRNGSDFGDWPEFLEISKREQSGGLAAGWVTTVSKSTRVEVMWLYDIPDRKITVVPNGIYPDRFCKRVDSGDVKKDYGIHPLAPVVLFVGRLTHQKGPDLLIEAIPRVLEKRWDVQFLIAGTGDLRAELEEKGRHLPVQFLGYVSDEQHLRLLNAADVVVIPSRNEPFGLVLTEAWSAGRCVVATDVGGLSENIDNFVDGIKVPVRADSIAWGINYVIDDPLRIRALGRAGRQKVNTKFTWEVVTGAMLEVYNGLIHRGDVDTGKEA